MLKTGDETNVRDALSSPWLPNRPFQNLPHLPPATELETPEVLKRCIQARAAMAELKVAADHLPDPTVLINTLPLLEAQASSEIENIVTTADDLFRLMDLDERADDTTREAMRYRAALMEGFHELQSRPTSTNLAEQICSRIKGVEMRVRRVTGTRLSNTGTGEVIYTPTEGEQLLRELLANWEAFVHGAVSPSLDPLVRMAVAHYQFEAIHPFTDGNGRTGRVLNTLFMVESNLLSMPILYLSRYFVATKPTYYRALLDVTRSEAWVPWIIYVLDGITDTAQWTLGKIAAIRALRAATTTHVRETLPRIYNRDVLDVLFEQPYTRISRLVDRGISTRQSASKYLHMLADAGVLRVVPAGRDKLFLDYRLLRLLTEDENSFEEFAEPT